MKTLIRGAKKLGLELDAAQVEQFETFYKVLTEWNTRINLTRIVDREGVQLKHFLDSLTIVKALPHADLSGLRILDVGSGAGFPGVPLKILNPQIKLCLLDSVGKRTAFLRHLVDALGLSAVDVVTARAETLAHDPAYRDSFDVVLSRAVAPLAALLELALPFCKIGGRFIAQKDVSYKNEPGDLPRALSLLGGELIEEIPVKLEGLDASRCLVIITKVRRTPQKYPRGPGVPARRPL
ncbi:MAG: 16S rRNA (guanine(527)-N(7))-methyltransferase RsmG [Dehalococcoidia bacterium]